jgi:FHA domain
MAKLLIQTQGFENRSIELRLGVNRVGRDEANDFPIPHPSVSTHHCELIFSSDGVVLHDLDSTNGSFVNGQPVSEVWLERGQRVRLGQIELFVEDTGISVSIPQFERAVPPPKPPLVLEDGSFVCPRHPDLLATFKCTKCGEVMCSGCVRMMRRQGGQPLFLCLLCHNKSERIITEKAKAKKGLFGFLQDTVRFKFGGRPKD